MTLLERINKAKTANQSTTLNARGEALKSNQSPWVKNRIRSNTPAKDWY